MPQARVRGYVDGFNLYFGLKSKGWRRFYWLDIRKLVESMLKPHQHLLGVGYFTSRLTGSGQKRLRQKRLLEAYEALSLCEIFFGRYLNVVSRCGACGAEASIPSEKMTDVNLAVELLTDAVLDRYDVAMVVSGDSDLTPAVKKVKQLFPEKRVVIALPPARSSRMITEVADASFMIGRAKLAASQLPDEIEHKGLILRRPETWA